MIAAKIAVAVTAVRVAVARISRKIPMSLALAMSLLPPLLFSIALLNRMTRLLPLL
jgi:hypothetical protein